jgi:WD40 repeat protein
MEEPGASRVTLDPGRTALPLAIAFSPDGRSLVVVGMGADPKTFRPVRSPQTGKVTGVMPGTEVSAWDAATGLQKWRRSTEPVNAENAIPVLSPDGHLLAVAAGFPSVDSVSLFDVGSGKVRTVLRLGQSTARKRAWRMAFSPDGKFLAGCTANPPERPYALQAWNCASGEPVAAMNVPRLADAAEAGDRQDSPAVSMTGVPYPACSPDGRSIAVMTGALAELREMPSGKWRGMVPLLALPSKDSATTGGPRRQVSSRSRAWPAPLFSPDGKTLAATPDTADGNRVGPNGTAEGPVYVIDVATGKLRRILEGFPNRFLAFHADGSLLGVASRGPRLKLAIGNLETGKIKSVLDEEVPSKLTIVHVAFSPDGKWLATTEHELEFGIPRADAYKIHVWDVQTGKQIAELRDNAPPYLRDKVRQRLADESFEPSSHVNSARLVFSPDARRLALCISCWGSNVIDLWTLGKGVAAGGRPAAALPTETKPSPAPGEQVLERKQ